MTPPATAPPVSGALTDVKNRKESKISLSRLSHRLREKFSRESRLTKRPLSSISTIEVENGEEVGSSGDVVSASTSILANIAASDGGYDSDARNILTPQIVAQLAAGPHGTSSNRPHRILDPVEDEWEASQASHQLGYDGTAQGSSDLRLSVSSFEDAATPRYSEQIFPPLGDTIERDIGSGEPDVHSREAEIPEFSTPTRTSNFAGEDNDHASLKVVDRTTILAWPFETLKENESPCSGKLSTSMRGALPNGQHTKRSISFLNGEPQNIYASLSNQEDPLVEGVKGRPEYKNPRLGMDFNLTELEESGSKYSTDNGDSCEGGQIPKASSSPELHIPRVRPRQSTIQLEQEELPNQTKTSANLIQSRFIENLEDVFVDNCNDTRDTNNDPLRVETRKTSQGWLSGGKRVGYNYDFVLGHNSPPQIQGDSTNSYGPPDIKASEAREEDLKKETKLDTASIGFQEPADTGLQRSDRKSHGLFPRFSDFMKSRRRHLSSSESALTDAMLCEARGSNLHMPPDENDSTTCNGKNRQFLGKWKRRSISDNTGRQSSMRKSRHDKKPVHPEENGSRMVTHQTDTGTSEHSQADSDIGK
ncbi:predicted protein [Uncinocarpus reesii 1704]|uniref:Uncharacterized protein n=1 Tax=Uncinocarpus reesii (strain UAMH 1704) TaxID=336963 RepID=C4JJV4_UNCRE|nr:uncharacterized protein UREG_01911 [Uncinocarpus reesii 1704]EEP77062.1 predicted protein [Uncinocarpus reesii 1704]